MTDHDEIRLEIPAFAAGRCDEATRARLERHAAECEECAALMDAARDVAWALAPEARAGHPDPADLRRHATGERASVAIAGHIDACDACALEARTWTLSAPVSPPSRRRWLPVAAALAAGVLLGAWAASSRPTPVPERFTPAPAQAPYAGGRAPLVLLQETLRDDQDAPRVVHDPLQPVVAIAVTLDAVGSPELVFEIFGRGGIVWSTAVEADRLRADIAAQGVEILLVPASRLGPGRYELVARPRESGEAVFQRPFEIDPPPSSATKAPQ